MEVVKLANFQNGISIACADSYFTACKKLPTQVLRDEMTFREKFMKDPTGRGLNYEKIIAGDGTIRSVRVNGSYRAIVKIPSQEAKNIYTLLWIDSHDEAYDWASKKHIGVSDITNAIEIYDVINKENIISKTPKAMLQPKLFDKITDADFAKMGISNNLLWIVRAIQTTTDFKKIEQFLPREAFEYISYLEAGFTTEEVIEMASNHNVQVGTGKKTFEEAVIAQENAKHFHIIDSDESAKEFNKMLEVSPEEWRIFLHPQQKEIVIKTYSGPACILGGAGTGKTVVAMHRAKWLAENMDAKQNRKILFTTFTSNLADDIRESLKILCSSVNFGKIEVVNLDKWVKDFLTKNRVNQRLIFGDEVKAYWEKAIQNTILSRDYPIEFYIAEYEKVILASEINNFDDYKSSNRVGRGISLNRSQKLEVWNVIEKYKILLGNTKTLDGSTAVMRVKEIIENSNEQLPYTSIIVDEGQDFGDASYRLIRAIAGSEHVNDIFIVGDAHQKIYGKKVVLKNCGINTVGRSGILKINYRTTEEIRKFANRIIKDMIIDDLNDGIDEGKGYISFLHGKEPETLNFKLVNDEYTAIVDYIKKWTAVGILPKSICILARMNKQVDDIRRFLQHRDISIYEIKKTKTDERNIDGIRIATMHRVKGLEFDCVLIADVNNGIVPLEKMVNTAIDNISRKELLDAERLLFYVAATRAKKELVVMSYGKPSNFIELDD